MKDCVEHNQSSPRYGYTTRDGKTVGFHRLAYVEKHGMSLEDIKGLVVRHKCDNPRCINPEHLEVGTQADNNADMKLRGRARNGKSKIKSAGFPHA